MTKPLSSNMEMYLKTILRLGADGRPVHVKAIAESLGVTMPSVSEALRSLKARGLVLHPSYGAVQLSARGRKLAEAINRRFEVLRQHCYSSKLCELKDLHQRQYYRKFPTCLRRY